MQRRLSLFLLLFGCTSSFTRSELAAVVLGQVTREGTPVSGAFCLLEGTSQRATTGEDGRFSFGDLPAGSYYVVCRQQIDDTSYAVLRAADVKDGEALELGALGLTVSGSVRGTVRLLSREDHAGVFVSVPGTSLGASSSATGDFVVEDVPEAALSLRFERAGFLPVTLSKVMVASGAVTELDVVLLAINEGVSGSVVLGEGAAVSTTRRVPVRLTYTSLALQMYVSEDSSFVGVAPQPVVETMSWTFLREGAATLYVRFDDAQGKQSVPVGDEIVIDTLPPAGEVVVAGGAEATSSPEVTLHLAASDSAGVTHMKLSNEATFAGVAWRPFEADVPWTLAPGDGTRNVFAVFRDAHGLESAVAYDAITVDTQAPGSVLVSHPTVTTGLAVALDLAGPQSAALLIDGVLRPYASSIVVGLSPGPDGPREVAVALVDAAGNIGPVTILEVVIDTTPPSPPVLLGQDMTQTVATSMPVIGLVAPSADAHFSGHQIFGGGGTGAPVWTAAEEPLTLQLFADGCFPLGVRGVDAAGNVSAPAWTTVCRDLTPPSPMFALSLVSVSTAGAPANIMRGTASAGEPLTCQLTYQPEGSAAATVDVVPFGIFVVPEQTDIHYTLTCDDAAGNTSVETFSVPSGTGVVPTRVPAPPWTAAGSPYWVVGDVLVEGPLVLEPGTVVRPGVPGVPASLSDISALDADGCTLQDVSLSTLTATVVGCALEGGQSEIFDTFTIEDSSFVGHALLAPSIDTSSVLLRSILLDSPLTASLLAGVGLEVKNDAVAGTSHLDITWVDTASVQLQDNSFLSVIAPVVALVGPTTATLMTANLTELGNYWNTQNASLIDALLTFVVGGMWHSGLSVVTAPAPGPHAETPELP